MGPWKTGSSSVRVHMAKHAERCATLGVDVPDLGPGGLSWMMFDRETGRPSDSEAARVFAGFQEPDIDWAAVWRSERDRVVEGRASSVVVASEFLHAAPDPMKAMAEAIQSADERVAVCCVRSQHEVAQSGIAELVRDPGIKIAEARRLVNANFVDYADIERRWSAFGKVSFVPYGHDVVPAVLAALSVPTFGIDISRHNQSPPASVVAYLYERKEERLGDQHWGRVCDRFLDVVSDVGRPFPEGGLLSFEDRKALRRRADEANAEFLAARPEFAHALAYADSPEVMIDARTRRAFDLMFGRAEDRIA